MNIAIISDTHDNLPNINKVLDYLSTKKIEALIHCGDVCMPRTLHRIVKEYAGPIYLSLGNGDDMDAIRLVTPVADGTPDRLHIYAEVGAFTLGGKKIGINHYPTIAKQLAQSGDYDLVFHGHSHKPWEEMINSTRLVNPGNVANMIYPPTFATYDTSTDDLQLIRVNDL